MTDDRKPCEFDGWFLWHPVPPGIPLEEQYDYLPLDVFRLLTCYRVRSNPRAHEMVKSYPTLAAAMLAYRLAVKKAKCPKCNGRGYLVEQSDVGQHYLRYDCTECYQPQGSEEPK